MKDIQYFIDLCLSSIHNFPFHFEVMKDISHTSSMPPVELPCLEESVIKSIKLLEMQSSFPKTPILALPISSLYPCAIKLGDLRGDEPRSDERSLMVLVLNFLGVPASGGVRNVALLSPVAVASL